LLPGFGLPVSFGTWRTINWADGLPQGTIVFFDFDRPAFGQGGDRLPEDPSRFSTEIRCLHPMQRYASPGC